MNARSTVSRALVVASIAGFGVGARAGDLNPPPGPVAPTMVTLEDIFAAVGGVGSGPSTLSASMRIDGVVGEGAPFDPMGIELLAVSHDPLFEVTIPSGGGGSAPAFGDLQLVGRIDSAFPQIAQLGAGVSELSNVNVLLRRIDLPGAPITAEIWFSQSVLTGISLRFSDGLAGYTITPLGQVGVVYRKFDEQGGQVGGDVEFCWNIPFNTICLPQ